ncbi:hypothetical protein F5X96DRAFT_110875 [Biscogniauxia mediterranea]|nr:hypothetical protein F5X96DRAFT_110875 [Biscogniauxia mediterranea]
MDIDFGPSSAALSQAGLAGTAATATVPAGTTTAPPASAAVSHGQHLHQGQYPSDSDLYAIQQQYQQYQQYQYYQQQQQQQHQQLQYQQANYATGARKMRKRKAESQDNERLSKRLSLLNLEKNGQKLYVPVESPQLKPIPESSSSTTPSTTSSSAAAALRPIPDSDTMQLDDTKHKVYIYDLDAELSSCPSDAADESAPLSLSHDSAGRLVFLPDIERHLLRNRIPASVLAAASRDGAGAGLDMQMVLYREPAALSVPEEQDSVRRAVAEARARARARALQRAAAESESDPEAKSDGTTTTSINSSSGSSSKNGAIRSETTSPTMPSPASSWRESQAAAAATSNGGGDDDDDPDAMDMD